MSQSIQFHLLFRSTIICVSHSYKYYLTIPRQLIGLKNICQSYCTLVSYWVLWLYLIKSSVNILSLLWCYAEQEADAEVERQRREREDQQKEQEMTLEETKEQVAQSESRLSQLKEDKHQLFLQLKKVLNEDDTRKKIKESNFKYGSNCYLSLITT